MRLDLREDPSVMQMAEIMGINETCIVGYCHAIWSWVSAQCPVDSVTHVTLLSLGRVTNTGRFPEAMARAGWVIEETLPDGTPLLRFPNFDRWLSNTAKKRLLDARRKKESRKNVREMSGSQADKSVTTGQESTGEKIRRKKVTKKDNRDEFQFDEFWAAYPTRKGKRLGKKQSMEFWKKMNAEQKQAAIVGAGHYAEWCRESNTFAKDAIRFLRDEMYLEFTTRADPKQEIYDELERVCASAFRMEDLSPEERAAWEAKRARLQGETLPGDDNGEPDIEF